MRATLHAQGQRTAGRSDAEIRSAYEACRRPPPALNEEWSRGFGDFASRGRELARKRTAEFLAENGVDVTGLNEEQRADEYRRIRAEHDAEERAAEARRNAAWLLRKAGCPALMLDHVRTIDPEANPQWKRTLDALIRRLDTGFLVCLFGGRGRGKTQLATHLIVAACKRGRGCQYVKRMTLGLNVRDSYSDHPDRELSEAQWVRRYATTGLLVVDEVHQVNASDFNQDLLIHILDLRYSEKRPTLLIANAANEQELAATLGSSIVSRMNEVGRPILCGWESFRKPSDQWEDLSA